MGQDYLVRVTVCAEKNKPLVNIIAIVRNTITTNVDKVIQQAYSNWTEDTGNKYSNEGLQQFISLSGFDVIGSIHINEEFYDCFDDYQILQLKRLY